MKNSAANSTQDKHTQNNNLADGRAATIRRRIQKYAGQHRTCKHLAASKSLRNSRRAQQQWKYGRPTQVDEGLAKLNVGKAMHRNLGETADRIGRLMFKMRADGVLPLRVVYEALCTGPAAMSPDCRRRHLNLLEDGDVISRVTHYREVQEPCIYLSGYGTANPCKVVADIRHAARRSQCRAAGTRHYARRIAFNKRLPQQINQQSCAVIDIPITPIANKKELATEDDAKAVIACYPVFSALVPASVVRARVSRNAFAKAAAHLASSPDGHMRHPAAALVDRAQRITPWHDKQMMTNRQISALTAAWYSQQQANERKRHGIHGP